MHDENEDYKHLLRLVADQPLGPSTVDIARAIETGKRRKHTRQLRVTAATASVTVAAAVAIPLALQSFDRTPSTVSASATPSASASASASASPPAKKEFQTRAYDHSVTRALPTSCLGSKLSVPGGNGIQSYVANVDPSGHYAAGRIYNDDKDPVIWNDGRASRIPLGGDDDIFEDVNTKGDAVGFSYRGSGPQALAYVGGVLTKLRGGSGQATAINDRGAISGYLVTGNVRRPVTWPSATSEPVQLAIPEGAFEGTANDIDEDGTIVGHISNVRGAGRIGYVWYPDGTAQALPTPIWDGQPAPDYDARRVRNGWVTGYVTLAQKRPAGVRWDLTTGKVMVLDGLEWSNGVGRFGWIVGMDDNRDAVVTDGVNTLALPNVVPKPADYGMNWGRAISDDGLTIVGVNDDKNYDGLPRAVVWKCS